MYRVKFSKKLKKEFFTRIWKWGNFSSCSVNNWDLGILSVAAVFQQGIFQFQVDEDIYCSYMYICVCQQQHHRVLVKMYRTHNNISRRKTAQQRIETTLQKKKSCTNSIIHE